jgi:hypothetical protein
VTTNIRTCLQYLHSYLANPANSWEYPSGYIIKPRPHVTAIGDASQLAGGAHCERLEFWFDVQWSKKVNHGATKVASTQPGFVHINSLEYIVVLLQLIAVIVLLCILDPHQATTFFPKGIPSQPILLSLTDNTSALAWTNKLTSKSLQGQQLIALMAELLRLGTLGINSKHIPGVDNDLADFISRPTNLTLSPSARHEQIYQKHTLLRTWNYFLPSPELLQLLGSLLFTKPSPVPPALPKNLGHFFPAGCTILCLPWI